jgi:hypothetical protein
MVHSGLSDNVLFNGQRSIVNCLPRYAERERVRGKGGGAREQVRVVIAAPVG